MVDTNEVVVPTRFEVTRVTGDLDMSKMQPIMRLRRKDQSPEMLMRDKAAYEYNAEIARQANLIKKIEWVLAKIEYEKSRSSASYIAARSADKRLQDSRTETAQARAAGASARAAQEDAKAKQMGIMITPEWQDLRDKEMDHELEMAQERIRANDKKTENELTLMREEEENSRRKHERDWAREQNRYIHQHTHDLNRIKSQELKILALSTQIGAKLQQLKLKREMQDSASENVSKHINERAEKAKERDERLQKHRLELIERRAALRSPLMKLFAGFSLPVKDLKTYRDFQKGKEGIKAEDAAAANKNLKQWAAGIAIGAVTYIAKKTLNTILSVSKKIVGVFVNAAKQSETFKTMMDLFLRPLVTLFTLLFVPVLIAMVPLLKTMFGWVINNKEAIMAVGEKLTGIFNSDNLNIVEKALDGILFVVDSLATMFANNASMIDTTTLAEFISSTILAISNMIQDILLGVVAFCYSPEGKAFITSVAYSVGKILGSVMETVIALLPMIIGSVAGSIIGLAMSAGSYLYKAVFNALDSVDRFIGGAISGTINSIVGLINSAINALNSINIFGFSPFTIPNINTGMPSQVGSSLSNFIDQGIVNNFHINNNMSLSSFGAIKEVMSTGVY